MNLHFIKKSSGTFHVKFSNIPFYKFFLLRSMYSHVKICFWVFLGLTSSLKNNKEKTKFILYIYLPYLIIPLFWWWHSWSVIWATLHNNVYPCNWKANIQMEALLLKSHFRSLVFTQAFRIHSFQQPILHNITSPLPLLLPPLLFHVLYWIDNYPRTKASHLHRFCQPFWYTVSQRLWLKPLSLLWQIEENSFRITNFPKSKTGALTSTPKATPWYWEHDFRCQKRLV